MTNNETPNMVEQNLERLLGQAYRPESPDPEFVQGVRERLATAARERVPAVLPGPRSKRRRVLWVVAAAAAVAGLAFFFNWLTTPAPEVKQEVVQNFPGDNPPKPAPPGVEELGPPRIDVPPAMALLTPRARPASPDGEKLALGAMRRTHAGERRRLLLPDGSAIYLNQKTEVKLEAERRLTLSAGEVYVEVAPRPADEGESARFVVRTPQREVTALGTRFEVSALERGTGVTVTQGRVQVSGLAEVLRAGQQLRPDDEQPIAAPRAAAALAWTRELMCAEEAPLVPPSKYTGGALVVNDATGQPQTLSLRKYHVDVHIEDGFARTTIDQTYFNASWQRLEGTFHFPLPPDASFSRLAMYVNGQLMEGGMAERDFARQTFESIVRKMKDPALLEWVDGSTFKMRVFPLELRQEKRIILSYTQRLPVQYGRTSYRFPAGHSLETVRDWSFHAAVKSGAGMTWSSDTHPDLLRATSAQGDLLLDAEQRNVKVEGDVAIDLFDGERPPAIRRNAARPSEPSTPDTDASRHKADGFTENVRFSSMDHDGGRYLMVRYRPELPARAEKSRQRRDWIVLFESSGDRDPLLARTQIEVVRGLLSNAEHDDTFAIITAATRPATFAAEPKAATADNLKEAIRFLERTHLTGVLDLGQALDAAGPFVKAAQNPYLVHVGSGHPVLGETKADVLVRRLPESVHYVGVGVGKRWNRALMKAAAERSGGYFTQINPDEPITWRTFELYSALTAPRLLDVKVVDNSEKCKFLSPTSAVTQGEEICAMTRVDAGVVLPKTVTVTGTLDGKTFARTLPVKGVAANAGYLPRTWARLEIDRLLAENAAANKARIVQLSMASYVMTPFTSLLVLENEQMYAQFGVDRGRKDHWAMYPCPATIPVLPPEPQEGQGPVVQTAPVVKPSAEQVLQTILIHVPPRAFAEPGAAPQIAAVTAHDLYAGVVAVPLAPIGDGIGKDGMFFLYPGIDGPMGKTEAKPELPLAPQEGTDLKALKPPLSGQPLPGAGFGNMPNGPARSGGPGAPPTTVPGGWAGSLQPGMGSGMGNGAFGGLYGFGGGGITGVGGFGGGMAGFGGGLGGSIGFDGMSGMGGLRPSGRPGPGQGYSGPAQTAWPGLQPPASTPALSTTGTTTFQIPTLQGPSLRTPGDINAYYSYFLTNPDPRTYGTRRATLDDRASKAFDFKRAEKEPESLRLLRLGEMDAKARERLARELSTYLSKTVDDADKGRVKGGTGFKEERKGDKEPDGRSQKEIAQVMQQLEWLEAGTERSARPGPGLPVPLTIVRSDALVYHRPSFAPDGRLFTDLLAFAPGLNTSQADILGVLEAEAAAEPGDAPGTTEPAARALIEGARAAGWTTLSVPTSAGVPAWPIAFDGSGRYAYERVLSSGLKEHVICDGKELLHLYPELGLGSRRLMTRFHRAELANLVPWALPPARDLAHGFDLKVVGERTVARVPAGLQAEQMAIVSQLIFAADGRLAERRVVTLPKNTVLRRETYGADGVVKVLNGDNKELSERKLVLKAGGTPDLDPELKDLVVLSLPYRTRAHLMQQPSAVGGNVNAMDLPTLLALIAADTAAGDLANLLPVVQSRWQTWDDHRIGFQTLLLSAGHDPAGLVVANKYRRHPVARYLERWRADEPGSTVRAFEAAILGDGDAGLLPRLAEVQTILTHWQQAGVLDQADCRRMVKFVRTSQAPVFVWAVVDAVLRTPDKKVTVPGGRAQVQRDVLEAACAALKDVPVLSYAARYEFARHLADNGDGAEAHMQFLRLYEETAKDGILPPVDRAFRDVLAVPDHDFARLLKARAAALVKAQRRTAVIALAWQCWELDDPTLANTLLTTALVDLPKDMGRVNLILAAVDYLTQTHQYDRADRLLQGLLDDPALAQSPVLWRLGYQLAVQRKQPARAFTCLAEALELEYRSEPAWIDVPAVRADYGALLGHYAEVVRATATLGQKPPADLAAKVVRAADRWRALDIDGTLPSGQAYQSLRGLGEWDLAWDYLLMSAGVDRDGFSWAGLAQSLAQSEDYDLAERAYAQACLVEPANAALAQARAQNLMQAGRTAEGRAVLHQIGDAPVLPSAAVKPGAAPEKGKE